METIATIWKFETARFRVEVTAEQEWDLDLSWDETGEVAAKVESGDYVAFCAAARVYLDGEEIASDFLGGCIYDDFDSFRNHFGLAAKSRADGCNYGSYFSDIVSQAIHEAREHMRAAKPAPMMRATA